MEKLSLQEKIQHSSGKKPFSYYKCRIPDYFPNVPLHWHKEIEINYVISGTAEFVCGDDKFITSEGDIVLVMSDMVHSVYPHNNSEQFYDTIVFSPDMIGASVNDRSSNEYVKPFSEGMAYVKPLITRKHVYYEELKTTVENIFSCAKGNTSSLDILLKSELMKFFWILLENHDIDKKECAEGKNEFLKTIIEYMNKNYDENITISDLACEVCMSKSYFMQKFRDSAGMGAIEYLSQLRVRKACEILRDSDISSGDTAFMCGFRNISNFNRQFRKIVGMTPKEYRRKNNIKFSSDYRL